jgi:hypothetical protein
MVNDGTLLKGIYGEWKREFLWWPVDIQRYAFDKKSKFRWLKHVYKRWVQFEYGNGQVYTVFEYAESLLDIIKIDAD